MADKGEATGKVEENSTDDVISGNLKEMVLDRGEAFPKDNNGAKAGELMDDDLSELNGIFGNLKEIVVDSDPTQDDKEKSKVDEVGKTPGLSDDVGNLQEIVVDSGEADPKQKDKGKAKVDEVGETSDLTSNDDETGKEKWKGEDGDMSADDDNEPGPKFPFPLLRNRLEMGYYVFDVPEGSSPELKCEICGHTKVVWLSQVQKDDVILMFPSMESYVNHFSETNNLVPEFDTVMTLDKILTWCLKEKLDELQLLTFGRNRKFWLSPIAVDILETSIGPEAEETTGEGGLIGTEEAETGQGGIIETGEGGIIKTGFYMFDFPEGSFPELKYEICGHTKVVRLSQVQTEDVVLMFPSMDSYAMHFSRGRETNNLFPEFDTAMILPKSLTWCLKEKLWELQLRALRNNRKFWLSPTAVITLETTIGPEAEETKEYIIVTRGLIETEEAETGGGIVETEEAGEGGIVETEEAGEGGIIETEEGGIIKTEEG